MACLAQNEMKAKRGMPRSVQLSEGLCVARRRRHGAPRAARVAEATEEGQTRKRAAAPTRSAPAVEKPEQPGVATSERSSPSGPPRAGRTKKKHGQRLVPTARADVARTAVGCDSTRTTGSETKPPFEVAHLPKVVARRRITFELSGRRRRGALAARRMMKDEGLAAKVPCRWRSARAKG
jgi:hypothetical protein